MTAMKYYVFRNRRNGKLIEGTDFKFNPPRQFLCDNEFSTPLMATETTLEREMKTRHISTKTYNVVEVMLVEVKGVIQ